MRRRQTGLICVMILTIPAVACAQIEGIGFPHGMHARYTAGEKQIERIDGDVAFVWAKDSPDQRLPAGPFQAEWSSLLLVRQETNYRLHAYLQGEVSVEIDGKPVLRGRRDEPGWLTGDAARLRFGFRPLKVKFQKTGESARLQLFWSSDAFPLEPLPGHLLFRDEEGAESGPAAAELIEQGRTAFDAHRCNRCHRRENDRPSPPAPSLEHVASGSDLRSLVQQIGNSGARSPHSRMPSFGFTREEARAVAAFLVDRSRPVELSKLGKVKPKELDEERRKGKRLLLSVGCLACHTINRRSPAAGRAGFNRPTRRVETRPTPTSRRAAAGDATGNSPPSSAVVLGQSGPYGGGDLSDVGQKRSAAWLNTWLADPEKLNRDHRMPLIKLSGSERRQLVLFLTTLRDNEKVSRGRKPTDADPEADASGSPADASDSHARQLIDRGRKLVEAARCAACHRIPGVEPDLDGIPDLSEPVADWSASCVPGFGDDGNPRSETKAQGKRQPIYGDIDREAVVAYVNSRTGSLSPLSDFERGRQVLRRRNCLSCHQRGRSDGLAETAGRIAKAEQGLEGKSQGLIPPTLNALGDKLRDEALAKAVGGEQPPRLPWLMVRMPRFEHSKDDLRALLHYLVSHDRIPAGDSRMKRHGHRSAANPPKLPKSRALVLGHTLVGPKGFSCIACHRIGDFEPRNVALGTRGSDLMMLGERMRREYYIRWTRSPTRITPGMEMPSYKRPVPGVLEDDVDRQLAVTWQALNNPDFTPPTDPASVEQFVVLQPGQSPRIIRDVFTNPRENGGGYVARSLAVGLDNGHNVLYDLDTLTVRGWYFGDFARQRTEGKSWYWDMAGVPVMTGFDKTSDYALVRTDAPDGGGPIRPLRRFGTNGRLRGYRQTDGEWGDSSNRAGATRSVAPHRTEESVRLDYDLDFEVDGARHTVRVTEEICPLEATATENGGWERRIAASGIPDGYDLVVSWPDIKDGHGSPEITARAGPRPAAKQGGFVRLAAPRRGARTRGEGRITLHYRCSLKPQPGRLEIEPAPAHKPEPITTVPGFDGVRLPLPGSIMPTAITWTSEGTLAFTSLKGHVYLAHDTDGDGLEDKLTVFEEGLAAPFGIIADGNDLIVAHKPEVLRLRDTDGDGRADAREVVATGWGYNDNYHDWTTGLVRDSEGNLYVGLGSDYAQPKRPKEDSRWRGKVLRISPNGKSSRDKNPGFLEKPRFSITPVAHSFRYPVGLAVNADDEIFVTDNQGVQNTFNEINHVIEGRHYGVPSRYEQDRDAPETPPAIKVPHPWTRSVNALLFLPSISETSRGRQPTGANPEPHASGSPREAHASGRVAGIERSEPPGERAGRSHPARPQPPAGSSPASSSSRGAYGALAGHGIGCEYNGRFLIRFTLQRVGQTYQGAAYYLSSPGANSEFGGNNFIGPMCAAVSPDGDIYVGSIFDSGWLGGRNVGGIVRLRADGELPNGIRQLRATADGFRIEFFRPVDPEAAAATGNYSISGYTRRWQGSYATPDSGRHNVNVESVTVSPDARTVTLTVDRLREGYVYEVGCGSIGNEDDGRLWPATGHYTMNRIPDE